MQTAINFLFLQFSLFNIRHNYMCHHTIVYSIICVQRLYITTHKSSGTVFHFKSKASSFNLNVEKRLLQKTAFNNNFYCQYTYCGFFLFRIVINVRSTAYYDSITYLVAKKVTLLIVWFQN